MWHLTIRYSMKLMLAVTAMVAVACFVVVLPTIRASRFAGLVRSGQFDEAEKMLPPTFGDHDSYRQVIQQSKHVQMQPLDIDQLVHFKRNVIVGWRGLGVEVEFVVGTTSISKGNNSFAYY